MCELMKTVTLKHFYPAAPKDVWELAIDFEALREVTEHMVTFEGLPEGALYQGQAIEVMVSLFGKLPKQPYYMQVVECDPEKMMFSSNERGSGVKHWQHRLTITPHEGGALLTDTIDIQAKIGLFTPLFAIWAKHMYEARHQPRLKILARNGKLNSGEPEPIVDLA